MAVIPVSYEKFIANYRNWDNLTPELSEFMSHTPGTSCCVQISQALNKCGLPIPSSFPGQRSNRGPSPIQYGSSTYLILAVDEMESYLSWRYPGPEDVKSKGGPAEIKKHLQGRTGILVFREGYDGFHAEPWNGKTNQQGYLMNIDNCLTKPRILFWDMGPPQWLQDYMATQ